MQRLLKQKPYLFFGLLMLGLVYFKILKPQLVRKKKQCTSKYGGVESWFCWIKGTKRPKHHHQQGKSNTCH